MLGKFKKWQFCGSLQTNSHWFSPSLGSSASVCKWRSVFILYCCFMCLELTIVHFVWICSCRTYSSLWLSQRCQHVSLNENKKRCYHFQNVTQKSSKLHLKNQIISKEPLYMCTTALHTLNGLQGCIFIRFSRENNHTYWLHIAEIL